MRLRSDDITTHVVRCKSLAGTASIRPGGEDGIPPEIDGKLILTDNSGNGKNSLIGSGLKAGEIVVTPGKSKLVESAKVKDHIGNGSNSMTAQSVLKRAVHQCSGGAAERPLALATRESNMQDPKKQKPVRQPELPTKTEPVQKQPANERPVEGQGVMKDERAQEQPADKRRAVENK